MKNNNKAYAAGWVVLILAIVGAVILGQVRKPKSVNEVAQDLDTTINTTKYVQYVVDNVGVLGQDIEDAIALYNANWDYRYNSVVAVVTGDTANEESLKTLSYDWADEFGLGEGDAILLIAVEDETFYFNYGDDFATIMTSSAMNTLSEILEAVKSGNFDRGLQSFYAALNGIYINNFGMGNADRHFYTSGIAVAWSVWFIVFLVILFAVLSAVDRARYNAYRAQYYGVVNPPVVFHPIFFWHGPRYGWYTRHWHRPPPPRPPRPPRGGSSWPSGGTSSGFGGVGARPSRGGGTFGGRPTGTGHRGGFGGSFGGGGRGGSFGGSRGGGFGGGSRGGGFGGRR